MQQNWNAAVRVFNDPQERAALGAWIMDDLGDTDVDRSLFRRQAGDANLSLASFIAQLRPDLPPVFRGRGAAPADLASLFDDPRPLFTGAPMANEMALLARPDVLRIMDAHSIGDPGRLRLLADHLEEAERVGIGFHRHLADQLVGWGSSQVGADPALILTFLLHPERMVRPVTGGDRELSAWVDILWGRVEAGPPPACAGIVAVVYRSVPVLRGLAAQQCDWERRLTEAQARNEALMSGFVLQTRLTLALEICRYALIGLVLGIGLVFAEVLLEDLGGGDFVPDWAVNLLLWIGILGLAGVVVVGTVLRVACGGPVRRKRRVWELQQSNGELPQLTSGVQRIRADLERARRICAP
ncbi:hypothetical protein [Nocardiopsis sp. LOL_012]|uniref:hypothetical protein n=1 Tax=Nocardiopsis sp. LOL_012 TaxID=3345409 RepID=UPI003A88997C